MVVSNSLSEATSEGERKILPLFPDLTTAVPLYRGGETKPFADPFLTALEASAPVQRLKGIGFLGAIDYIQPGNGRQSHRRRHNRYDHSIGVARLAQLYAELRQLNQYDTRVFVAASILHDVGHGPLSHTLEPIFQEKFGIGHHAAGERIIRGETSLGDEVQTIMRAHRVDLDEVVSMIVGEHSGPNSYLFSSPINFDTIEGVTRSSQFMVRTGGKPAGEALVQRIAEKAQLPTAALDQFWKLKHDVYNVFIHTNRGLVFDGLAQAYMLNEIDRFKASDFLLTENQLRHKEPTLFHLFAWARTSRNRIYVRANQLDPKLLRHEIRAPRRTFFVNAAADLASPTDLYARYRQKKESGNVTIGQLVKQNFDAATSDGRLL